MPTPRQRQRQNHRDNGRYAKVNPCYHCGRSAGVDYYSHAQTDTEGFADIGLVLCAKCATFLEGLSHEESLKRLRASNYGDCPQPRI